MTHGSIGDSDGQRVVPIISSFPCPFTGAGYKEGTSEAPWMKNGTVRTVGTAPGRGG